MRTLLGFCAVLCLGCGTATPTSLAEAEQLSQQRGVALTKKGEDYKPPTKGVENARNYTSGKVELHAMQFESIHDADQWESGANLMFSMMKFPEMKCVQLGRVRLVIDRGPDDEIAAIMEAF